MAESPSDLQRELEQRQLDGYRRLQHAAAGRVFRHKYGRQSTSVAEIESAFPSGTIRTIDPHRHLSGDQIAGILASTTTTATGRR